jgi:hypothetical protein
MHPMPSRLLRAAAAGLLALIVTGGFVYAQRGGGEFGNIPPIFAPDPLPDRDFVVCRLMYTSVVREPSGGGWRTDYPYGEINLSIRYSELTRTRVSMNEQRRPNHYVVRATDEALFQCPFLIGSDVGTIGLTDEEAANLRAYLLKGGFLWVDDFWGTPAWQRWTDEIAKVLDPRDYPIVDVPLTDPVFHSQFSVQEVPQITNIGFWRRSGGLETRERYEDSPFAEFKAIRDTDGRLMVVMTHNTDVADSWEREGEDPEFFLQFSPYGYALGINVLLHAMTH